MEAVKKHWLLGIFISILSIFAMSHNANAVQPVFDISNYDILANYTWPYIGCKYANSGDYTFVNAICTLDNTNKNLYALSLPPAPAGYKYETGDIVQFDAVVYGNTSTLTIGSTYSGGITNPFDLPYVAGSTDFSVLSVEPIYFENNNALINYYNSITCRAQGTGTFCEGYPELTNDLAYYQAYRFTVRFKKDLSNRLQLQSSTTIPLFALNSSDSRSYADIRITRINIYRPIETQENKEVEEKTQGAVDDSQAAGGSSSTDAQTGTTGLLNAITGAVSVISSAQPTNCKINGNMGNLDIGQLDLCANPAPAFVQTIGSLILILMCVPLAISLFNRFIAIFRSFQS